MRFSIIAENEKYKLLLWTTNLLIIPKLLLLYFKY